MRSEKNGNVVIEDIKFVKKGVILIVDSKEIKISTSTYSHFYLYKDKKISQKELDEILEYQEKSKLIDYSFSLLSKGMYSQKQIEDKLKKKKAKKEIIDEIIDILKDKKYIDDNAFVNESIEIYERKNFGKNKIISKLKENGIKEELLDDIDFKTEKEKIMAQGQKFISMHSTYSKVNMKASLYRYLQSNGFIHEDINSCIDKLMDLYNANEYDNLLKTLKKYVSLHHFELNDFEDREKVISYLLRKGYRRDDIINVLRRQDNEVY